MLVAVNDEIARLTLAAPPVEYADLAEEREGSHPEGRAVPTAS